MYISYLVYPFIPNGHLLFSFLMTVNSAAMNKYLFETLLALLWIHTQKGIAGPYDDLRILSF